MTIYEITVGRTLNPKPFTSIKIKLKKIKEVEEGDEKNAMALMYDEMKKQLNGMELYELSRFDVEPKEITEKAALPDPIDPVLDEVEEKIDDKNKVFLPSEALVEVVVFKNKVWQVKGCIIRETPKAIQFQIHTTKDSEAFWIPKSQLKNLNSQINLTQWLPVPTWILKDKKILLGVS